MSEKPTLRRLPLRCVSPCTTPPRQLFIRITLRTVLVTTFGYDRTITFGTCLPIEEYGAIVTTQNCGWYVLGSNVATNAARSEDISFVHCLYTWSVHPIASAIGGTMDDDVAPRMAFVLHDVDDEQLLLISIETMKTYKVLFSE